MANTMAKDALTPRPLCSAPTVCSSRHVPGYVEKGEAIKEKGIDDPLQLLTCFFYASTCMTIKARFRDRKYVKSRHRSVVWRFLLINVVVIVTTGRRGPRGGRLKVNATTKNERQKTQERRAKAKANRATGAKALGHLLSERPVLQLRWRRWPVRILPSSTERHRLKSVSTRCRQGMGTAVRLAQIA